MKDPFPFYSIGHFINQPGNPTQFEITRFEEMDEPEVEDPHKHTFYEIIWVEEGVSKQVIDYREYEMQPLSFFFISPGQVHQFEEWQVVKGGSIFFTESFFLLNQQNKDKLFELSYLDNFYANPFLLPGAADYTDLKGIIDWLLKEKSRPDPSPYILQSLLHVLLAQVQRLFDRQTPEAITKKHFVIFKKFKDLLETHFAAGLMAGEYAEQLHVTPHHLNHVVKLVTGRTASEVIRARTMLEAKRLLTFTDQTVSEVAAGLGMFDASYFARVFRAETGVSPAGFKKAISEKYRIR
jgi:AraC-like DNA-binding protein